VMGGGKAGTSVDLAASDDLALSFLWKIGG
jgi:hypothetical protein